MITFRVSYPRKGIKIRKIVVKNREKKIWDETKACGAINSLEKPELKIPMPQALEYKHAIWHFDKGIKLINIS